MKGLVKYALGPAGVELRDLPEPEPREGELKVRVYAAGICGSDMHAINDQRAVVMPVVLGHEFTGEVVGTCGDVGDFRTGDWVSALPACYSCGSCELCRAGLVTLCAARRSIGSHVNGAMADYVVVPAKYSFKLPAGAKTLRQKKLYALAEPLCCMVRGVYERIDVKPGDLAVVSGPGTMGLLAAQLLKARGAAVVMSGLPADRQKLDLALQLGMDAAVTSFEELKSEVFRCKPLGAEITCDAVGAAASFANCVQVARPCGVHLQVGIFGKPVTCDLDALFLKELAYVPTNSSSVSSWKTGMKLIEEGKVALEPLISMERPLSRWREAFDAVNGRQQYKVLLFPDNGFAD